MTNSIINSARTLLERANASEDAQANATLSNTLSELKNLGASPAYINGVAQRLSSFSTQDGLEEAANREIYKASQFALMEDDEEDATGKGSEDAQGKGVKFARPAKTKGDAKKSLKDKAAGKDSKMEHLEALFSGEELTDSFKRKAAAIFEAAVNARVEEIQAELVRQSRDVFVEEVISAKDDMAGKLDDYMNYVVNEWMQENELAIESGIQNEISESFMNGLQQLFENHYIDVPQSKVNLVEQLTNQVEGLKKKLNNSINENVQLSNAKTQSNCDALFESACHGLADTEIEKFRSLARGIEYSSEAEFSHKLATIKESYFGQASAPESTENVDSVKQDSNDGNIVADMSDSMARYTAAISRGKSRDIYGN